MGSPETEPERSNVAEPIRRIAIPRRFAIATKEVTVEQFRRFVNSNNKQFDMPNAERLSNTPRFRTGHGSVRPGMPPPRIATG